MAAAFDEMYLDADVCRPGYAFLQRWLQSTPPDVLAHRRAEAELLFQRIGITFAVYGSAEAEERIIPFDIIPRIFTKPEWQRLERGLEQRLRALNLFLADVYGNGDILAHPAAAVQVGLDLRSGRPSGATGAAIRPVSGRRGCRRRPATGV